MANESHHSMKESERAHKTTMAKTESHTEQVEERQEREAATVHAHEKATVPDGKADGNSEHPAIKHSVGHYVERDGGRAKPKGLRRHRG